MISTTSCASTVLTKAAVSVPHVERGLLGELPQDEEQQLVVVPLEGQVLVERPPHRLHDGVLLRVDERLEHDAHRHVDVVLVHELAQRRRAARDFAIGNRESKKPGKSDSPRQQWLNWVHTYRTG